MLKFENFKYFLECNPKLKFGTEYNSCPLITWLIKTKQMPRRAFISPMALFNPNEDAVCQLPEWAQVFISLHDHTCNEVGRGLTSVECLDILQYMERTGDGN